MLKVPVKPYKVGDIVFYRGISYKIAEVYADMQKDWCYFYYRLVSRGHALLGNSLWVAHYKLDEESEFEIKG